MTKSYVTILVCPWCKKETNELALDRRLRDMFEKHTESDKPCDDCMKKAIILYDKDTKRFIGYAKKESFMSKEALEQYKETPVNALCKTDGKTIQFFDKEVIA